MDSRSNALLSRSWVGENADSRDQAQRPLKALLKAIRGIADASADAKRMQMQASNDWPALNE